MRWPWGWKLQAGRMKQKCRKSLSLMASWSHHASLWLPINRLLLSDEEINLYPVQFTDSLDCLLFAAKGIPNWYPYQISSLLSSCHCAWNSPTRDASFVLSLPFMGTSTHIKVEAGGPMKFNQTFWVWFSPSRLWSPPSPPALVCF